MPRALTREEQVVLTYVRKQGGSLPIPDLAQALSLSAEKVQACCEYLVGRGLLHTTIYAVSSGAAAKS